VNPDYVINSSRHGSQSYNESMYTQVTSLVDPTTINSYNNNNNSNNSYTNTPSTKLPTAIASNVASPMINTNNNTSNNTPVYYAQSSPVPVNPAILALGILMCIFNFDLCS
jgi:hypothetical protein